jgi:hypothetical protein
MVAYCHRSVRRFSRIRGERSHKLRLALTALNLTALNLTALNLTALNLTALNLT